MFGFGKKKNQTSEEEGQPLKPKNRMDKLVMGAIIGVAVGSVVGIAMAPQKGKNTRKMMAEKGKIALAKGKEIGKTIYDDGLHGTRKTKKGLLKRLMEIITEKEEKKNRPLRRIPREEIHE